jgi:acetyl-CoA carboxylase biotin carboxyl carrier protein
MQIESEVTGVVCRIEALPGQAVAEGDALLFVESMKMEIPICAERAGTVSGDGRMGDMVSGPGRRGAELSRQRP